MIRRPVIDHEPTVRTAAVTLAARLARLEGTGEVVPIDNDRPSKANTTRRKTRKPTASRSKRPTRPPIEGAYAASRDDDQPDETDPPEDTSTDPARRTRDPIRPSSTKYRQTRGTRHDQDATWHVSPLQI